VFGLERAAHWPAKRSRVLAARRDETARLGSGVPQRRHLDFTKQLLGVPAAAMAVPDIVGCSSRCVKAWPNHSQMVLCGRKISCILFECVASS